MKTLLIMLFLISGCSVTKMYRASDVSYELKKNRSQLEIISSIVHNDFAAKEEFFRAYKMKTKKKNEYIIQDLTWRLSDLESQKNSIIIKTTAIKLANDKLLSRVNSMEHVKDTDPVFEEIEYFGKHTKKDAISLFKEFEGYQKASQDFYKFAVFTGDAWKKSTRY